ncbi:DUF1127 domain-containing protein [Aliivibrio kagoshimensis]|uniref:DUF1127 domain-containing protein n=1 Tax=Aliivibrio kagoshimensis TaxID=2910230 RepID=UPI003D1494D8
MSTLIIQSTRKWFPFNKELVKNILTSVSVWKRNRTSRAKLSNLPDYILDDIGLTKQQAKKEVEKYFWQK